MAQSFVTESGSQLYIPGTYVNTEVKTLASNIGTAGVLTIIGEADEGPDFTAESDLSSVVFTPDQLGDVIAKYGSGRIVDAFATASTASNDANITGSVQAIRIVKTNKSTPATLTVKKNGFGDYLVATAKKWGTQGNLIKVKNTIAQFEKAPQSENLLYIPSFDSSVDFSTRTNGGATDSVSISAKMLGEDAVSAIENLDIGILATGGLTKKPLSGLGSANPTLSASLVSGYTDRLQVSLQTGFVFASVIEEGDTVIIPDSDFGTSHASAIKGGVGVNNCGAYVVLQITNTSSNASLILKKLAGPSATLGSGSGAVDVAEDDIIVIKSISIYNKTGEDRQSTVGLTGTFTTSSNDGVNVVISSPSAWSAQPVAGDIVKFEADFAGVLSGFYEVISSLSSSVTLVRKSNGSAGSTGSEIFASVITQATQPFIVLKPEIDGLSKTLEIDGDVESIFFNKTTYVGANISNKMLTSSAEKKVLFLVSKGTQQASYTVGGDVVLQVACDTANSWIEISAEKADLYKDGSLDFSVSFKQYKILSDLVAYINAKSGYSASISLSKFNTFPCAKLDKGSFAISTASLSNKPAKIKNDVYSFETLVNASPLLSVAVSGKGLPEVISPDQFLEGGVKGGTLSADVVAAIDACESLETNFIVPLFSVDADADIVTGETESSSTYVVEAINSYISGHVSKMSTEKMRKNRSAICSVDDSYDNIKEAANALAAYRVGLAFQKVRKAGTDGLIHTYQPWMSAIVAAGMQLAAGYKGIVKKFANVSGIVSPAGFNMASPGDLEDALKAGLLVLERVPTGGFRWVSDQTTYSIDNNFVYNSLQAVYVADLMALTLIVRFDRAVVGKSVAEISAAGALAILESEMFNFYRLRWITSSDDAIKGYKNASVKITGGVMQIRVEVKLAGLIYFVPIALTVSQVEQTA